jgi:cystathionine beta-lyase
MNKYNFDEIIERHNTDSLKYDFALRRGIPEDVIPLWVADMDFKVPNEVVEALNRKSQHGIFGYSDSREDYFEVLQAWFDRYFSWKVQRDWLVKTPGIVYAVATAIRAFTNIGDGVLIQEPVYYPFRESIEVNDRIVVVNKLVYNKGSYTIDFDDFEEKIIEGHVKVFILCSPHNPVGRVWSKKELIRMGDLCLKHDVLIVSDEIHQDFIYPGHTHYVFADLDTRFSDYTITCTAPSKTFNLAGLQLSNIWIVNRKLRKMFKTEMAKSGYSQPNIMGLVSCSAAYKYGHDWLHELKDYLQGNLAATRIFLEEHIPEAILIEPEGTYLIWVDCSEIPRFSGMSQKEMDDFMVREAGIWLDGGTMFGVNGEGFQRINIACPRETLLKALKQWYEALNA